MVNKDVRTYINGVYPGSTDKTANSNKDVKGTIKNIQVFEGVIKILNAAAKITVQEQKKVDEQLLYAGEKSNSSATSFQQSQIINFMNQVAKEEIATNNSEEVGSTKK